MTHIAQGVDVTINEAGNLIIEVTEDASIELLERRDREESYWSIWSDLLENYSCNGSYHHLDGGYHMACYGGPVISESVDITEEGDIVLQGRLWAFHGYEARCDLRELGHNKRVCYHLAH